MIRYVLDASAVLALLNQEPGHERIGPLIPDAAISTVNLAEVVTKIRAAGTPAAEAVQTVDHLALEVIVFDQELAMRTGELYPVTRRAGLSLGDRACIATAERLGVPVLTADRAWADLPLGLPVEIVR